MILSYSQVAPYLVQAKSDGQYICDNSCQQWLSSQLCSHTVAVAEHNGDLLSFLQWYITFARNPNMSTLAMIGLPHGRGRRAKRQRNRTCNPPVDDTTVRPGLQTTTCLNDSEARYGTPFNVSQNSITVGSESVSNIQALQEGTSSFFSGPPPLIRLQQVIDNSFYQSSLWKYSCLPGVQGKPKTCQWFSTTTTI